MNAPAIAIGGVIPAILPGVGTVLMRYSIGAGASIVTHLATVGTTIAVAGWTAVVISGDTTGGRAVSAAVGMGLTWSAAIACMSYGFWALRLPVSVIAPITNSNAIVAVALVALLLANGRISR